MSDLSNASRWGVWGRLGVAASLPVLTLSACATLAVEHQRFVDGWRSGSVVQIGRAEEITARFAVDCRGASDLFPLTGANFALVRYTRSPSRYAFMVTPLPAKSTMQVGEKVVINIRRCDPPLTAWPTSSVDANTREPLEHPGQTTP